MTEQLMNIPAFKLGPTFMVGFKTCMVVISDQYVMEEKRNDVKAAFGLWPGTGKCIPLA